MGAVIHNNRRHLRVAWKVCEEVTLKLRSEGFKEPGKVRAVGVASAGASGRKSVVCSHRKPE